MSNFNIKHLSQFLGTVLQFKPKSNIPIGEIRDLYNYWCECENLPFRLNNNYLVVLFELYCATRNWDYAIYSKAGTKQLQRIGFSSEEIQELSHLLSNGIANSPELYTRAHNLYSKIQNKKLTRSNSLI